MPTPIDIRKKSLNMLYNCVLNQEFMRCEHPKEIDRNHVGYIRGALSRLVTACNIRLYSSSPNENEISRSEVPQLLLSDIEELLETNISTWDDSQDVMTDNIAHDYKIPAGYYPKESLKKALLDAGIFHNVENILRENGYVPNIPASELCVLARDGNISKIMSLNNSRYQVNKLVGWALFGFIPSLLGDYSAFMIAAAYRQLSVVKYFIESNLADRNQLGGRLKNSDVLYCARIPFFLRPNRQMIEYLENHNQTAENNGSLAPLSAARIRI